MAEAAIPDTSLSTGSEFVFDVVCAPCIADGQQKEAESYCQDCREHLCGQCVRYHTRLSSLKHHRLVDIDAAPLAQDDQQVRDVCAERCQDHSNEIVKYFCPDHKALACGVCVTLEHKRCEHMTYIHDAAVRLEDGADYKEFTSRLGDLRQLSEDTVTLALESKQRSSDCHTKVIHDLDTYREELVSAVDSHVDAIRDQSDQIYAQNAYRMDLVAAKGNSILEDLHSVTTSISSLQFKKHFCKMFVVMKQKVEHFTELKMTIEKASDEEVAEFSFQRDDELRAMIDRQDGLGKIVSTSSKIGESSTTRQTLQPSDTQEVNEPSRDVNEVKASRMTDINIKSDRNETICQVTGMAMVSNNTLVVADNNNDTIKLIDTSNSTIMSEHKLRAYPWGVTVCKDTVATTLPGDNKIVFLNHTKGLVQEKEINVEGSCKGIDWYDDKLYVVYDVQNKLEIMTTTGQVLQRVTTTPEGEQLFTNPAYLAVSAVNQRIYVSNWSKGRLIELNMDGKPIAAIEKVVPRWLKQMAVDRTGIVYLADYSNDIVQLKSPCGGNVKVLLNKEDGVVNPYSLCYCENTRRLYLGMFKCDIVRVYQVS